MARGTTIHHINVVVVVVSVATVAVAVIVDLLLLVAVMVPTEARHLQCAFPGNVLGSGHTSEPL